MVGLFWSNIYDIIVLETCSLTARCLPDSHGSKSDYISTDERSSLARLNCLKVIMRLSIFR